MALLFSSALNISAFHDVQNRMPILSSIHNLYCHDSYTTVCLSVRGDNPRASASGLSPVQAGKRNINFIPPSAK